MKLTFPSDFRWGAATSAYQIEGATTEDGRGPCVWDMLSRQPGRIRLGTTANTACDHYHRWPEDIALMRQLGLSAYRLSLSWTRFLPAGTGAVNQAGLAYYDRLIDGLLAAGIEPWVTLFHWDYPQALYRQGGWLNPDSPRWFADYARLVTDHFSDRVKHWITLNEPQCFIGLGLFSGDHAPGDRLAAPEVLLAAHHALLAHGLAAETIRSRAKLPPKIGWATTGDTPIPASNSSEDIAAAREEWASTRAGNFWSHTWWNDPLFLGHYPEAGLRAYGEAAPKTTPAEMRLIAQPLDFYGTNNYRAYPVRRGPQGQPETTPPSAGAPLTHLDWDVSDDLLRWSARWPHERYGKPIVITENGMAGLDWVNLDGRVPDGARIDYTRRMLLGLHRAITEGVDVGGYFHWSFLDNFEWNHGYRYRFGLVHVDFNTLQRTPKDSFSWYREVIRTQGAHLNQSLG